jgi:hypothetical protein
MFAPCFCMFAPCFCMFACLQHTDVSTHFTHKFMFFLVKLHHSPSYAYEVIHILILTMSLKFLFLWSELVSNWNIWLDWKWQHVSSTGNNYSRDVVHYLYLHPLWLSISFLWSLCGITKVGKHREGLYLGLNGLNPWRWASLWLSRVSQTVMYPDKTALCPSLCLSYTKGNLAKSSIKVILLIFHPPFQPFWNCGCPSVWLEKP